MTYNPADFTGYRSSWGAPGAINFDAGGKSDTVDIETGPIRKLRVSVAGNVKVTFLDDTEIVLPFLAGETMQVIVKRVWTSGTTATGVIGFK